MDECRGAREVPASDQGVQKIRQPGGRTISLESRKLPKVLGLSMALGSSPERDQGYQRPVRGVPADAA